jgi:hypothetical protein
MSYVPCGGFSASKSLSRHSSLGQSERGSPFSTAGFARLIERAGESAGIGFKVYTRLTDKAANGEILISDSVHRALAERVDCSEVGELAIKGLAKPVRAWRLRAFREPARSGRQGFVGRHRELQQLEAALAQCRDTRHGGAIYIRGEAGIGKTRLLEQFQAKAEGENFAVIAGWCSTSEWAPAKTQSARSSAACSA